MPERSKRLRILAGPNGSGKSTLVQKIYSDNNIVIKDGHTPGVYDAAITANFIRFALLEQNNTFTFETVLSHPSKLNFLMQAKALGYKNYLYFICTVHPSINIARVEQRVKLGGHNVPTDRIVKRYVSSLELLPDLIPQTYRTYLFDNSAEKSSNTTLIAEIDKGQTFIPRSQHIPWWVNEYVIKKLFT